VRIQLSLAALVTAIFACSMHASPAQAQRVFVGGTGSDSNPCTFASPCRSFQHAHDVAPAGGEIDVLDPAGYGSLTITKSISIQGHDFSGISAASGDAIDINAGPSDRISLRGLLLEGSGAAPQHGISITSASSVDIDECVIRNFGIGIFDGSAGSSLFVSNSLLTGNIDGVIVSVGGSATTRATISRVQVNNSVTNGIQAQGAGLTSNGALLVTVSDSNIAGSGNAGVQAVTFDNPSGPIAVLVTRSSIVAGNGGLDAFGNNVFLRVHESAIAHNAIGWLATSGATFTSWGNNAFNDIGGNGDNSPTQTPLE
jgi:hypothetical protein